MHAFERMELGRSVDPFVNLATVNYILAGIQRFWNKPERVKWQQLMVDMDFGVPSTSAKTDFAVQVILIACYRTQLKRFVVLLMQLPIAIRTQSDSLAT